jgi:ribosomal-protein-alanine N-acetyltransferase
MKIEIRLMQSDDLPQVIAIEQTWPYLSKWGQEGYRTVLSNPRIYTCLVAEDANADSSGHPVIAGFAILALLIDHCELCNLVVPPEYISKKVGYLLLQQCIEVSQHLGVSGIFLEVRQSNHRAIHFYEKNGFQIAAERKNYYRDPPEDAWVMERRMTKG